MSSEYLSNPWSQTGSSVATLPYAQNQYYSGSPVVYPALYAQSSSSSYGTQQPGGADAHQQQHSAPSDIYSAFTSTAALGVHNHVSISPLVSTVHHQAAVALAANAVLCGGSGVNGTGTLAPLAIDEPA